MRFCSPLNLFFCHQGVPTRLSGGYDPGVGHLKHIEWTDGKDASSKWALERLAEPPPSRAENPDVDRNGETLSWSLSQEKIFLLGGDPDVLPEGNVRALLRDVLEEHRRAGDARAAGVNNGAGTPGGGAGACLTDTWVSGERFAWVDLQAGPFAWGPAAGGDGYKSALSGLTPVNKPLANPPGGPDPRENRRSFIERRRRELITAREKLSARVDRLLALREQMACDEEGEAPEPPETRGRAPRRRGAVAVACEEVLAQLTFVRQFQAQETEALSTADAAEAAEAAAVLDRGGSTNETFARNLESLRSGHVSVLQHALGALAPATESDHGRRGSYERSTAALSVDSQALLSRLAALVSSLSRGIVTPASTLLLPVPPPDTLSDATRTTSVSGSEGSAGWPRTRSGSGGNGTSSAFSSPRRLPIGPALMQPRGSGIGATTAAPAAERWVGSAAVLHRLGAANAAHPSPPSALEFFIPDTLEFTLYVVSVQDVYPPLGAPRRLSVGGARDAEVRAKEGASTGARGAGGDDGERTDPAAGQDGRYRGSSGFDLPAFQEGAMSLKLPNQKASFTVHQVDSSSGAALVAALAGATKESSVNGVTAEG